MTGVQTCALPIWITDPTQAEATTQGQIWRYNDGNTGIFPMTKGLVEYIGKELPEAKLVMFSMTNMSWDMVNSMSIKDNPCFSVLNPDGSLSIEKLKSSNAYISSEKYAWGLEQTANYYGLQFIPVHKIWGVTFQNWGTYYNSLDVHPKKIGYDRVAEVLAAHVV